MLSFHVNYLLFIQLKRLSLQERVILLERVKKLSNDGLASVRIKIIKILILVSSVDSERMS